MAMLKGTTFLLLLACVQSAYGADGLYVSNSTHILFQAKDDLSSTNSQPEPVHSNDNARIVGLTVDVDDGIVFWSDVSFANSGIYRGDIGAGGTLQNVKKIVSDVGEVNGLAVDWHRNLIYWTDCTRHSIELADYNGDKRLVLSIDGLGSPRGIVLDLENGYLFWNDQETQKIERSYLDGSEREEFATDDVYWPNQMAVRNGYLYCVDAKSLKVLQYRISDGTKKVLGSTDVYGANTNTKFPFGLAVDEYYVYVSIWYNDMSVVRFGISSANQDSEVLRQLGIEPTFSLAYFSSASQPNVSNDPCPSKSCDGICLTAGTSARCTCPSFGGETLQTDGQNCEAPTHLLFYVLADEGIVAFKDLGGSSTLDRNIVGRSIRPVAVAYDPVEQFVYWSDVHERSIHKAHLDGSDHTIFMSSASHSIGVVDGLTLDSVGRKLYYSNMGSVEVYDDVYSWSRIEFIGLDGKGRKTIVDNVGMPRDLYLDQANGHLYYTDWGNQPAIVRVNVNGSSQEVIIVDGLDNPNALTMLNNKLYVLDSHYKTRDNELNPNYPVAEKSGALYSVNIDGTGWTKEALDELETPFGLAAYNGKLYISDWAKKAIYEYTPGGQSTTFMSNIVDPMALYYSLAKLAQVPDQCSSESCEEVCVVSGGTAECLCDSYTGTILTNSGNCQVPEQFILFGDFNAVKLIDLSEYREPGDEVREAQVLIEGSSYFSNFVALAYDKDNKLLYHTDVNRKSIYRTHLEDVGSSQMLIEANSVIDGMDLDDGKLYWTSFENGSIHTTDTSNNETRLLISGLSRPRAIKVKNNYIYWTEWGSNPRVMRASKDGSNQEVMQVQVIRPNGLDVDTQYLYVGDSSNGATIHKCDLDGGNCGEIQVRGEIQPQHIFSLRAEANRIYITDWEARTLSLIILNDDFTEGTMIHLAEHLMRPTEIIVQTGDTKACPPSDGCSDECKQYFGGYVCTCPDGKYLMNDGKTCRAADSIEPCKYNDIIKKVGETFYPEDCISCTCEVDRSFGNPKYGNATCILMTCPTLNCDESQQVINDGECCRSCDDSLCTDTPITINQCSSGTLSETFDLGSTEAYVEHVFELEGRDNCDEDRQVTVTNPELTKFVWQKDPHILQATANAPGTDPFTCDIEVTVRDVTPPSVTCPNDQTLYHTEKKQCVDLLHVTDNVCGSAFVQEDCEIEGENCRQMSVGSHTFTYTAKDMAGNENTCSFQVTIKPADLDCPPFNVQNGDVECNSDSCTVTCHTGTTSALVNNNNVYTCQSDGSYQPPLPSRIETNACIKTFRLRLILVNVVKDLHCPIYSSVIVAAGLQIAITTDYISDPLINKLSLQLDVVISPSGCDAGKKKRSTEDFSLEIELSTETDDTAEEDQVKGALQDMMERIRADIISGKLLQYNGRQDITEADIDRKDPLEGCRQGEVRQNGDSCIQCPKGTKANTKEKRCQPCPVNEYNDKEGSINCKVCPDGKITDEEGTTSRSLCYDKPVTTVDTTEIGPEDDKTIIIIAVVVAVVVVVTICIIVVVYCFCCKRNKGDKTEKKDVEKFDNPMFKDEDVYEEPPDVPEMYQPKADKTYQGLETKKETDANPYDNLNAAKSSPSNSEKDAYMMPVP